MEFILSSNGRSVFILKGTKNVIFNYEVRKYE